MITVEDFTTEQKENFLIKLGYSISDWRIEDEISDTTQVYYIRVAYKEPPPLDKCATDFVTVNSLCGLDRVFEKEMKSHLKTIFLK